MNVGARPLLRRRPSALKRLNDAAATGHGSNLTTSIAQDDKLALEGVQFGNANSNSHVADVLVEQPVDFARSPILTASFMATIIAALTLKPLQGS